MNELQKGAGLSASPTASAKGNEPETVQPSENKLSYEAQKELNKKIKKLERQVADCEASIEETESAIAIVEAKMATPEGASDMQLYERHQKLKQQLDGIVERVGAGFDGTGRNEKLEQTHTSGHYVRETLYLGRRYSWRVSVSRCRNRCFSLRNEAFLGVGHLLPRCRTAGRMIVD